METPQQSQPVPTQARPESTASIWVVEDSVLAARQVMHCLDDLALVEHHLDPALVIERLSQGTRPHVLIVDWELDGMNGVELCHAVREYCDEVDLPIVMLTGHRDRCDVVDGLGAGANDYLAKPFRPDELKARVRVMLRLKELLVPSANDPDDANAPPRLGVLEVRAAYRLMFSVMEQLPTAAIVHAPDGRPMLANRKARALLGGAGLHAPYEGLRTARLDGSPIAPSEMPVMRALAGGQPVESESWWLRPDGLSVFVRCSAAPILGDDGAPLAVVSIMEDITERQDAETERRRGSEELLAMVGHDLRNPLQAIMITTSMLLKKHAGDDRTTQDLMRILSSAQESTRLLHDLLDFTRVRLGGGMVVERVPMELRGLVEEHVTRAMASDRTRKFIFECPHPSIEGQWDEDRLGQVLSNLLGNAATHGAPGAPVRVRLFLDGGAAVLQVTNAGAAIPPEALATLFQPFRRTQNSPNGRGSGVGLGLYIVEQIVASHGGNVAVTSEAGEVTFTVRLPLVPAPLRP